MPSRSSLQRSGRAELPRRIARAAGDLARRLGNEYSSGSKLPPLRELSTQLGVAKATAHEAVKALVADGLLVSQPRQGTFVAEALNAANLSYRRGHTPEAARGLLAGKRITLVHADVNPGGHRQKMADDLGQALACYGGAVHRTVGIHGQDVYDCDPADEMVIFIQPVAHLRIQAQRQHMVLVLTAGLEPAISGTERVDVVSVDQQRGGELAGQMLRETGCASFCFLGRGVDAPAWRQPDRLSELRLRGFEQGLGQLVKPEHRLLSHGYSVLSGGVVMGKYLRLRQRPQGVFAASDDIALGFIAGAVAHGLEVGRDFRLIGFDAQESIRRQVPGGLASIGLPLTEMAQRSAELLHARQRQPDQPAQRLYVAGRYVTGASVTGLPPL